MRWDPAEFERAPSRFHRVLGIACAVLAMVGTGAMTYVFLVQPITIGLLIASSISGALFVLCGWLCYRFAFTRSVALSPRAARRLLVVFVICALLNPVIRLVAHLLG